MLFTQGMEMMFKTSKQAMAFTVLAVLLTSSAADEVTDSVADAMASYKEKEYSKAAEDLGYALSLIRQKQAENLQTYLPAPLGGWSAEPSESASAGAGIMGGGITASRKYTKSNAQITVEIVTDSPMLQSVAMFLSNPMYATSSGGKMIRVHREKALLKFDAKRESGEIQLLIDNRILVTVKGNRIAEADLTAYAEKIDYRKLKSL